MAACQTTIESGVYSSELRVRACAYRTASMHALVLTWLLYGVEENRTSSTTTDNVTLNFGSVQMHLCIVFQSTWSLLLHQSHYILGKNFSISTSTLSGLISVKNWEFPFCPIHTKIVFSWWWSWFCQNPTCHQEFLDFNLTLLLGTVFHTYTVYISGDSQKLPV